MSEKLDMRKELKHLYSSSKKPNIVEVSSGKFLAFRGRGEPGGEAYRAAINALYSVAYTLKFKCKSLGKDFTVMALESLWWFDDPKASFEEVPQEKWNWKSMIRLPDFVTDGLTEEAKSEAMSKKGLPEIDEVVLEEFREGLSAQILHIGPYSEERRTVASLQDFIRKEGYRIKGPHHEIYLSDPNRTAPDRLKTIIRHAVERA